MAKTSGLGDNFYVGGYDLSGTVGSVDQISGGPALLDVTTLRDSAHERIGGLRDGAMQFTSFADIVTAAFSDGLHTLPTSDTIGSYFRGSAVGNPAACINAKQVNYDPTRGTDGSLTLKADLQANSYGLEWGQQLTPGRYVCSNSLTGQNTGFEGGIGTWTTMAGAPTLADSSAQAHGGTSSLSLTATASGLMQAGSCTAGSILTNGIAAAPGQTVYVQAWVRAATSARTASVAIACYDNTGTPVTSPAAGTSVSDNSTGWTLISGTFVTTASTAFFRVVVSFNSVGGAAEVHYVDDVAAVVFPAALDGGGSTTFGAQAYLQVFSITGTDATIAIQDSADNVSFSPVSGLAFAQVTAAPGAQRAATASGATIREYAGLSVTSSGGFTGLEFAVALVRNSTAVTF